MKVLDAIQQLYQTSQAKPWKLKKPVVIQFPVNDICNARCQMCNIWQQKFDYQITPAELEKALSNPLFSEVRGIGINGGEPTLRKDLAELIDVLYRKLPKLSNISLITNSLNSGQVIERINEIGTVIKAHSGHLDVMTSLDGVGEVHDRVRGRKGNFENVDKVIDFIQDSELVSSYRLGCTVIKENIYGVHDLFEYALNKDIYIKYRLGIPHQRLYSKEVTDPFSLTFEEKYHFGIFLENLIRIYEKSELQNFFYRSLIGQLMYQKARSSRCDWQHRGATLSARGELLYCAVESKTLGSAISEDSEKLYFDNQDHLTEIIKNKCDSCAHDYVGLPPTKIMLKNYAKRGLKKLGVSPNEVKGLKFLQPVLNLRNKVSFDKQMSMLGVDLAKPNTFTPVPKFSGKFKDNCRVLICGWYGTETLGDKAILGGVVSALRSNLGNVELHLASLELYISEMTVQQMPELRDCRLHSISDAIEVASSMDLVVFGGGPIMAIPNLAEMIAIFQQAVRAKVPTLIAGCGVGPLGDSYYNSAIKQLLLLASHRIYRDQKSLTTAQSLGIDTTQDQVAEDPALTWLENSLPVLQTNNAQQSILLGLRDWPYQQYANHLSLLEGEKIKQRFEREVITALAQLIKQYPKLSVIPFPMCTNHIGDDDRWFYRRLFRNHKEIYDRLDLKCLGAELNPADALQTFQSASIALTMRFHSLVFALSIGIPSVAIDYTLGSGKVKSLATLHQVPHRSLDAITSDFIVESCSEYLNQQNSSSLNKNKLDLLFTSAVNKFINSENMTRQYPSLKSHQVG